METINDKIEALEASSVTRIEMAALRARVVGIETVQQETLEILNSIVDKLTPKLRNTRL